MYSCAHHRRVLDRVSVPGGMVIGMGHRITDCSYRSTAELMRAIRDEYLLTQDELAGRTGLSRYQLCRWEKGAREPTLEVLRRVLAEFGMAVTFGVELSTAELDERLAAGVDAIGLDPWLLANRVMWPALKAGVPMVFGGEFAAGLQGVPIEDPELVVNLRLTDLAAFRQVVQTARCTLGIVETAAGLPEPEAVAAGSELAVVAMVGTIRILLVDELPIAKVISIVPQFAGQKTPIDVPVAPLAALRESGLLRPAAAALAGRLLQRAPG